LSIYAVNGKEPVAAWIPSLDAVGNGTTTLTDLVGSNNGTLTNMDAATDWVADTNAGGVRALDFDGVDDIVTLTNIAITSGWSVSCWFNFSGLSGLRLAFSKRDPQRVFLGQNDDKAYIRIGTDGGSLGSGISLSVNTWYHMAVVIAANGLSYEGFVNGSSVGTRPTSMSTSTTTSIGAYNGFPVGFSAFHFGRSDDYRLWNQPLVLADVQYLYGGGFGRGITAGGGIIPILRQHYAAQGAR
jgi:hypothetical protein